MSIEPVSYKAIVEYICNPDKYDTCQSIAELPDKVDDEDINLYWGLLGIIISATSNWISGSGWNFNTELRYIGWSLQKWTTNTLWGPVVLMWLIRFLVDDNETVNWLYVLTSNFTMLGPVLLYWISIIMIVVGWALDGFDYVDSDALIKWVAWVFLAFFGSFYQVAWINEVNKVYTGDNWTFSEEIEDLQNSTEDTI